MNERNEISLNILKQIRKRHRRNNEIILYLAKIQQERALFISSLMEHIQNERRSEEKKWGGRKPGSKNIKRGKSTWIDDYVKDNAAYPSYLFRRRFSVPKTLYLKLKNDLLEQKPENWQTKLNGIGYACKPTDVKLLSCLRILSCGTTTDSLDDATRMSEEIGRQYMRKFLTDVEAIYGGRYLNRRPNEQELNDVERKYRRIGVPGCIGAVDCMKIFWKNCPVSEKGQHLNKKDGKLASIQCEAWCDHDLYCWAWNAGRVGTNNDITVLYRSPLFQDILNGTFSLKKRNGYKILRNGVRRFLFYFLVDGIYPDWPIFLKPIHQPINRDEKKFSKLQEGIRKDIERLFGVLQTRFEILRREFKTWDKELIISVTNVCVILNNMIVRMHQKGELLDEVGNINVVSEMLEEEEERLGIVHEEYDANLADMEQMELDDEEAEQERLLYEEYCLTNVEGHHTLTDDVIELVRRRRNDYNMMNELSETSFE